VAAFNKELRCNLHKVHLLCLVSHGLMLSDQCDDQLLQAILLSLLPREHIYGNPELYKQESLLKLLKWFLARAFQLSKNIESSHPDSQFQSLTAVQLLVALMRAVSLRTRLVLVLEPLPFKKPPAHGGRKSSQDSSTSGSKGKSRTSLESDGVQQGVGAPEDSQVCKVVESAEGSNGNTKHGAKGSVAVSDVTPVREPPAKYCGQKRKATKNIAGNRKKRRTSTRLLSTEADSKSFLVDDEDKSKPHRGRGIQSRGKEKSRAQFTSTECKDSPYFKKAASGRGTSKSYSETLKEDIDTSDVESDRDSDSDYVPLGPETQSSKVQFGRRDACVDDDDDGNDSDDVDAKCKGKKRKSQRRKKSVSPPPLAKKLRLAVDKSSLCEAGGSRRRSKDDPGPSRDALEAEESPPKNGEMYSECFLEYIGSRSHQPDPLGYRPTLT